MFNVRLAGGHLYGKQLFTWLSLVVSLMASFVLSFFPLDVLDEIWDLIESVSEGFLTYSCSCLVLFAGIVAVDDATKVEEALNNVPYIDKDLENFSVEQIDEQCVEVTINSPRGELPWQLQNSGTEVSEQQCRNDVEVS